MKKFRVSKEFIEIYKNFNIFNQTEAMWELSRKELLLLLTVVIDNFTSVEFSNSVVVENLLDFDKELDCINKSIFEKNFYDKDYSELLNQSESHFITSEDLEDEFGNQLPQPVSDNEAKQIRRSKTINIFFN